MNIKEIKEIVELMKENHLREFEMERDGLRISLKRGFEGDPEVCTTTIEVPKTKPEVGAVPAAVEQEIKDNIAHITSPMVGTFYATSAPDAAPYVVVGHGVEPNDTVCIIEAMKVMNEIKAEIRGKIKEILIKNGDPVEFGQPLFVIEKA